MRFFFKRPAILTTWSRDSFASGRLHKSLSLNRRSDSSATSHRWGRGWRSEWSRCHCSNPPGPLLLLLLLLHSLLCEDLIWINLFPIGLPLRSLPHWANTSILLQQHTQVYFYLILIFLQRRSLWEVYGGVCYGISELMTSKPNHTASPYWFSISCVGVRWRVWGGRNYTWRS